MLFEIENGEFLQREDLQSGNNKIVGVYALSEIREVCGKFGIKCGAFEENIKSKYSKFESNNHCDFITVNIPREGKDTAHKKAFCAFDGGVLIFSEDPHAECAMIENAEISSSASTDIAIYLFMKSLTSKSGHELEKIEGSIDALETGLIKEGKTDCVEEIIVISRNLAVQKRFFGQLFDVYDNMIDNDNKLLSGKIVSHLKAQQARVDRLFAEVQILREQAVQVRESYQAQVDINLNNTMKVFTVMASIFLPLTVIVGWYGMNLKMPEYGLKYGYPMVIAICIISVVGCVLFFKKKKWF